MDALGVRQRRQLRAVHVLDRHDERFRQAPVAEHRRSQLDVVRGEAFALDGPKLGGALLDIGLLLDRFEDLAVGIGINGHEREPAHLRKEAAGERLGRDDAAGVMRPGLGRHAHRQRMGPEAGVVEGLAGASFVLRQEREAESDVADESAAELCVCVLDRRGRPGAAGERAVGDLEEPAAQGGIAHQDLRDFLDGRFLVLDQSQDRQRHSRRRRELIGGLQLVEPSRRKGGHDGIPFF